MAVTRYAILGAGAVGGYYGGMLASAGHEVHFIVRSDYDTLRTHGLELRTDAGHFQLNQLAVHRSADTVPPCDIVLCCLKTTQQAVLAQYLPHIVAPQGVVVTLQNGLGAEERLAELIEPARVWGAICFVCATRPQPGQVRQTDTNGIIFAPLLSPSTTPSNQQLRLINELHARLLSLKIEASLEDDLALLRWRKLAWNIPYNALSAHLRATTTQLNQQPEARALVLAMMHEVLAACRGVTGKELPAELPEQLLSMTDSFDHYRPSMLIDAQSGRELELEAILGEPVRRAHAAGVAMPRTATLYQLLQFQQSSSSPS